MNKEEMDTINRFMRGGASWSDEDDATIRKYINALMMRMRIVGGGSLAEEELFDGLQLSDNDEKA